MKSPIATRTQPRLRRFVPLLPLAALLAGVATDVFAQETRKEAPATGKDRPAAASVEYALEVKDGLLVWNGPKRKDNASQVPANLQNVIDLLRELHPEANFVVSPELGDTVINDLKMRTSSVEEKLEAIRIASGSAFQWRNTRAIAVDRATGLPVQDRPPSPGLYILEALPATGKSGLQLEAFHLGEHFAYVYGSAALGDKDARPRLIAEQMEKIERMAAETVHDYEQIRLTLNTSKATNSKETSLRTPSIRFHPGANLVIIIGEPEAVAVVAKVIGALPGAKRSAASDAPGYGVPSQNVDEVIRRLQRDGTLPGPRR